MSLGPLEPIHNKEKLERKRQISKNTQIKSENKRQTSNKIFAFAFAIAWIKHNLKVNLHLLLTQLPQGLLPGYLQIFCIKVQEYLQEWFLCSFAIG